MKKYIALLLLIPTLALAQEKGNFAEIKEQFLSKGNKKIDYELSITQGEALIFKSDFSIMNGEKVTLFKREIHTQKENINGKKLTLGENDLGQELDVTKEKGGNIEILRLKSEITRDTNNIISQFSIVNMDIAVEEKESKKASIDKEGPNGSYSEENPNLEKIVNEIAVSHQKNKDILFTSDDKTFYLKAKY